MCPVAVQMLRMLEHLSPPDPQIVSSDAEEPSDSSREFQRISKNGCF